MSPLVVFVCQVSSVCMSLLVVFVCQVSSVCMSSCVCRGAGIAQWLERRIRDRKVAGSNPCWSGGRIFFSRVNFLC